ncbi:MAG: hypothetical protein A3I66_05390 [Burkholderiales bacterium RIFCSPLOWO2_02_FULL_57_36]|nr:MAG: hypothetical protein A3I66_05390 [Burkholderiales bacterium RIFCSPLOWO2_02_FULL_57_36]
MKEFDPRSHVGAMPSPCTSICTMNPRTGLCAGCFRTIDEIMQWSSASEEVKRTIWMEIKRRQDGN